MTEASAALVLITFVDLFVFVFNVLLISRVLSSYFANPQAGWYQGLVSVTEPVLGPVRKVLPQTQGIDFAPLVTFFLLQGLQILIHNLLGSPL